jgi:hypothetical protein
MSADNNKPAENNPAEALLAEIPVATYRPSADANVEEIWKGIERSQKISREHNRDVMRDHIGASTAAALTFATQMRSARLIHTGPDIVVDETEEDSANTAENPPQPGVTSQE